MGAGSTLGAFFDGIQGTLGKKLEQKHEEEQARKKELRDFYLKGILNADTDEQAKHAADEYAKLSGPGTKKGFQQIVPFLQRIRGARGQQQQQGGPVAAPGGGQPMDEKPTAGVPNMNAGQLPQRAQFDKGPNLTGIYSTGAQHADIEQKRKLEYAEQNYQFWEKKGKQNGLSGRDLAEYAASSGTKLPVEGKRVLDKGVARPGEDPSTAKQYEGLWDHTVDKDGTETWAKRPDVVKGSGSIRSVPHSVSLQDAKAQAKSGRVFKDTDDKEIDLEALPPGMGLQAMEIGDKLRWIPITPNQKTTTVGNVVYATTPYNVTQVGQPAQEGGPVALGQQRTGSSNTPTVVKTDAAGVPHVLGSTTQPNTPGAKPSGGATPAAAPRSGAPAAQPTAAAPSPAPGGGPREAAGVPLGLYNAERNRAIPVREAATQIFGDPSQPDIKGLKEYIHLADDPASRERLGKALRLTFDGLNQATGGSHVSAEAGPISVSTGGIGSVLQNYFGVPAKLAEQQSEIMGKAIGDLTPEEKEYYNSVMSSFSTIVGLRSLTKASAAQASVSAIERELPVIGVNTFDSRQGYDQMQRLAEVVSNGTIGMPPGMIDPALIKRIKNLPAEMQKLKAAKPAAAPDKKGSASGIKILSVTPVQ